MASLNDSFLSVGQRGWRFRLAPTHHVHGVSRRKLLRFGGGLLVVDDDDFGTGYALDVETGIWRAGGDTWTDWLATLAHELTAEVVGSGLTGRALTASVAQVQRLKRPGMVDQVRRMLRGMLPNIRRAGNPAHDVTECHARELNADTRYIGVANGVVDLRRGELLSPEQGRRYLVTLQAPIEFEPDAADPYVDRLFAHLGDDAARWWWRVLGFHLMGAPSRRFYVAVGPPAGGKSTLANALCGTLGPYAARPADDALEARPGGSAGLSPELEAVHTAAPLGGDRRGAPDEDCGTAAQAAVRRCGNDVSAPS